MITLLRTCPTGSKLLLYDWELSVTEWSQSWGVQLSVHLTQHNGAHMWQNTAHLRAGRKGLNNYRLYRRKILEICKKVSGPGGHSGLFSCREEFCLQSRSLLFVTYCWFYQKDGFRSRWKAKNCRDLRMRTDEVLINCGRLRSQLLMRTNEICQLLFPRRHPNTN